MKKIILFLLLISTFLSYPQEVAKIQTNSSYGFAANTKDVIINYLNSGINLTYLFNEKGYLIQFTENDYFQVKEEFIYENDLLIKHKVYTKITTEPKVTEYEYDKNKNLKLFKEYDSEGSVYFIKEFLYDTKGRVSKIKEKDFIDNELDQIVNFTYNDSITSQKSEFNNGSAVLKKTLTYKNVTTIEEFIKRTKNDEFKSDSKSTLYFDDKRNLVKQIDSLYGAEILRYEIFYQNNIKECTLFYERGVPVNKKVYDMFGNVISSETLNNDRIIKYDISYFDNGNIKTINVFNNEELIETIEYTYTYW